MKKTSEMSEYLVLVTMEILLYMHDVNAKYN